MEIRATKALVSDYVYFRKSEVPNLERIKQSLFVQNQYKLDEFAVLYTESDRFFGIPIHSNIEWSADEVIDKREEGKDFKFNFRSTLWDGQTTTMQMFRRAFDRGETGFILEASPGSGKTVMALQALALIAKSFIIVVPRSSLVQQWVDRIMEHTDISRSEIGTATDASFNWSGQKVLVALVHTITLPRNRSKLVKDFGVIVFDEVDRAVPPKTFAPVATLSYAKYRIGISATLKRKDGMHRVFEERMMQRHLYCHTSQRMRPSILAVYFSKSSGKLAGYLRNLQRRGVLITKISKNLSRNMLIAKYAQMMLVSGRRVVIISDRTEQLALLRKLLHRRFQIAWEDMGFYVRQYKTEGKSVSVTKKQRENTAEKCGIILATYGMMSLGTDIKDLAGMIYATPQSDVEQTKGRIERVCEGKKTPIIVDIIDTQYEETIRWFERGRRKNYQASNLKITIVR